MGKLYLDERELRAAGLTEPTIRTLRTLTQFVETQEAIAAAQGQIDAADADIATLTTAVNSLDTRADALEAEDTALDDRLDALEAAGPYVEQDQGAAWSAATGTASRATFDTATATAADLAQRMKALIDDLQANGALT